MTQLNDEERMKLIYVDNSVVSGMFDAHMPERVEQTGRFWQAVMDGKIRIIASEILSKELEDAPKYVQDFFDELPESQVILVESTLESERLATEYIGANVISENHMNDCMHIAIATVTHADAVVSWNCDDMVNPNRIPKYNEVNKTQGYTEMMILTPGEFMEKHHDET